MLSNTQTNEDAELKGLLARQGLFDRQPVYYAGKVLQNLSLLVLALGLFIATHLFWGQILNAAVLAVVFTQIAFMGHAQVTGRCFSPLGRPMPLACCAPC